MQAMQQTDTKIPISVVSESKWHDFTFVNATTIVFGRISSEPALVTLKKIKQLIQFNTPYLIAVESSRIAPINDPAIQNGFRKVIQEIGYAIETHLDLFSKFFQFGADVNMKVVQGVEYSESLIHTVSAIHTVAKKEQFRVLLELGANVNARNSKGESLLNRSIYSICINANNGLALLDLLLSYDADVNLPDSTGYTPLMNIAIRGPGYASDSVLEKLIRAGADIDTLTNNAGETVLDIASKSNPELVAKLRNFPKQKLG